MKHIESILPENVADELTRLLLDDATISSALKDFLHRDTGCDIPSLDNVPTSNIEEIIPLCLSILRRFWNTPLTALGDGIIKISLDEIFRKLFLNRINGDEKLGVTPINGAVAMAADAMQNRKIDVGDTIEIIDGISLAQVLGTFYFDNVREVTDNNIGWTMTRLLDTTYLPNIEKITLGCEKINITNIRSHLDGNSPAYDYKYDNLTEISAPYLKYINYPLTGHKADVLMPSLVKIDAPLLEVFETNSGFVINAKGEDVITFPKLVNAWVNDNTTLIQFSETRILNLPSLEYILYIGNCVWLTNCPKLEELNMPKFQGVNNTTGWSTIFSKLPNLRKVVFGVISNHTFKQNNSTSDAPSGYYSTILFDCPNAIHVEFGGALVSLFLASWLPINALRTDTESEDYVDLRETTKFKNNLEQFLSNFQTYIADRVADMTGKTALTLTLSSAVYAALEAQEGQTILATLANKNWNVAQA